MKLRIATLILTSMCTTTTLASYSYYCGEYIAEVKNIVKAEKGSLIDFVVIRRSIFTTIFYDNICKGPINKEFSTSDITNAQLAKLQGGATISVGGSYVCPRPRLNDPEPCKFHMFID